MAEIKDLKRMCAAHTLCFKCKLYAGDDWCKMYDLPDNADEVDEIVDKWVKEHPLKTYAMDFFKKFPDAPKGKYGTPIPCIKDMYDVDKQLTECFKGNIDCLKCWNQEIKNG